MAQQPPLQAAPALMYPYASSAHGPQTRVFVSQVSQAPQVQRYVPHGVAVQPGHFALNSNGTPFEGAAAPRQPVQYASNGISTQATNEATNEALRQMATRATSLATPAGVLRQQHPVSNIEAATTNPTYNVGVHSLQAGSMRFSPGALGTQWVAQEGSSMRFSPGKLGTQWVAQEGSSMRFSPGTRGTRWLAQEGSSPKASSVRASPGVLMRRLASPEATTVSSTETYKLEERSMEGGSISMQAGGSTRLPAGTLGKHLVVEDNSSPKASSVRLPPGTLVRRLASTFATDDNIAANTSTMPSGALVGDAMTSIATTTASLCSTGDSAPMAAGCSAQFKEVGPSPMGSSVSTREPSLDLSWPSVEQTTSALPAGINTRSAFQSAEATAGGAAVHGGMSLAHGWYTREGRKLQNPAWKNQDAHLILELGAGRLFAAVFDGHGQWGHLVAARVRGIFEQEARKLIPTAPAAVSDTDLATALRRIFEVAHSDVKCLHLQGRPMAEFSGSTATAAVIDTATGTMALAHVGDSASILARQGAALRRSRDHIVDAEAEAHVLASGGEVRGMTVCGIVARRVFLRGLQYPGLAMARALGDLVANDLGVLSEPEVHTGIPITDGTTIVVASDGVWEKMEEAQAASRVCQHQEPGVAAKDLVESSRALWDPNGDIDDITAVVVKVHKAALCSANSLAPALALDSEVVHGMAETL
mmetsp:Transcript_139099/g.444296  ORF Transcript_139099/g.444296 Transcript_139099/m.444296 type:complete len:704 (-) Transcript_139099:193-2304(-)